MKFEEEEKKKKQEEEEDSKFDYMTLLVNTTKRHGGFRKGLSGNALMGFKHSNTKKVPAGVAP